MSVANSKNQDVILKKNDPAPFDGVLQSEENYRFDQNEIIAKQIYEKHQKESQVVGETSDDFMKGILIGVIGGLVGGLAFDKFVLNH